MVIDKRKLYLDCKVKIDSLLIFLNYRRYGSICSRIVNENIDDMHLYEKTLYFEVCHLASEVIEKLFQLLSKNNNKNINHSLDVYLNDANISGTCITKIKNLVYKNKNCFVETRYPDYYNFKSDEYELSELLLIANELLVEANRFGYKFDNFLKSSKEYEIFSLNDYIAHNRFLDYLINKYSLEKLSESINSSCDDFTNDLISNEINENNINKKIIIELITKNKDSNFGKNISGTLEQKYAYCDALAKYYTLDWYLVNIDRIVYGESGENTMDLETSLSLNFINNKSHDNDVIKNYIYYNACHLAAEAIEKMFKAILLFNGSTYEDIKNLHGHSFSSMFEILTENQKQLIFNESLWRFGTSQIKILGTKPNKPDKSFKKYNQRDFDRLYSFDEEDLKDIIIFNAVKEIEEHEGDWNIVGKNLFIINKRKGELHFNNILKIMDKAFIETRYPEQFSINFNYKYNLNYMIEILKSLRHITELIFEIWRHIQDNIIDYEMEVVKESHPELLFDEASFTSPYGNKEYHVIDNPTINKELK